MDNFSKDQTFDEILKRYYNNPDKKDYEKYKQILRLLAKKEILKEKLNKLYNIK